MFLSTIITYIRNKVKTMKTIKMTRIRKVKLPTRATPGSCGYDMTCPIDLCRLDFNKMAEITKTDPTITFDPTTGYLQNIILKPQESILIPSGIKINVPEGYTVKLENKSSTATVKELVLGACIIDNDYQGEVLINLHNISKNKFTYIQPGDKLCQMVIYKIETPEVQEVETPVELFKDSKSERGDGGFGSTDVDENCAAEIA